MMLMFAVAAFATNIYSYNSIPSDALLNNNKQIDVRRQTPTEHDPSNKIERSDDLSSPFSITKPLKQNKTSWRANCLRDEGLRTDGDTTPPAFQILSPLSLSLQAIV